MLLCRIRLTENETSVLHAHVERTDVNNKRSTLITRNTQASNTLGCRLIKPLPMFFRPCLLPPSTHNTYPPLSPRSMRGHNDRTATNCTDNNTHWYTSVRARTCVLFTGHCRDVGAQRDNSHRPPVRNKTRSHCTALVQPVVCCAMGESINRTRFGTSGGARGGSEDFCSRDRYPPERSRPDSAPSVSSPRRFRPYRCAGTGTRCREYPAVHAEGAHRVGGRNTNNAATFLFSLDRQFFENTDTLPRSFDFVRAKSAFTNGFQLGISTVLPWSDKTFHRVFRSRYVYDFRSTNRNYLKPTKDRVCPSAWIFLDSSNSKRLDFATSEEMSREIRRIP